MEKTKKMSVRTMVIGALLTALVFILQFMGGAIRVGTFSFSIVLIPIVIGAITCGKKIGAWLGFVFAIAVFATGDASFFMGFNPAGTVITVLLKGVLCGYLSGLIYELIYKAFSQKYKGTQHIASIVASIVCPVVNTGVFLLGCKIFLMDAVSNLAGGSNLGEFMIFGLVGVNFLIELAVNVFFAPVISYIVKVVSEK